jgi:hypothetical protein
VDRTVVLEVDKLILIPFSAFESFKKKDAAANFLGGPNVLLHDW